ncbi:hypothetical protein YPPY76_3975, partial [Yersinia pestis PY-76]
MDFYCNLLAKIDFPLTLFIFFFFIYKIKKIIQILD